MGEYYANPNQRMVNVNKESVGKNKLYAKINIDAISHAMKVLKPNTYKLWCYFAKNQNEYTFWLSAVDVLNFTGMSESSYHRAFDELVDKCYLIRNHENRNYYDFYELPHDNGEQVVKITVNKSIK